jgi:hypothetical protein
VARRGDRLDLEAAGAEHIAVREQPVELFGTERGRQVEDGLDVAWTSLSRSPIETFALG